MIQTISDGYVRKGDRILGRVVDGKFQQVVPVPEGADFDDLLDGACTTIEHAFGKHLASDYSKCQGQHSSFLLSGRHHSLPYSHEHGGVESWIREGTLRSLNELTPIVNAFLAERQRGVRMRKLVPDWQTTRHDFQLLGSKFGLPAPPSLEELERQRQEEEARIAEDQRRRDEAYAELRKQQAVQEELFEQSVEGRRARTVKTVVEKLLEHLPVPVFNDAMSEKERKIARIDADLRREEHEAIEPYVTRLVELSGWSADAFLKKWNEASVEKSELEEELDGYERKEEVTRELFCFRQLYDQISQVAVLTPSDELPPAPEGAKRLTFADAQAILQFARSGEWGELLTANETKVTMAPDRTYVLDVIPLEGGKS